MNNKGQRILKQTGNNEKNDNSNSIPVPVLTLNIKGQNSPIKRQRLPEWKEIEDPSIFSFKGTPFSLKNTLGLKVQVWKKIVHAKETKRNQGSYASIRQNRLEAKDCSKTQHRSQTLCSVFNYVVFCRMAKRIPPFWFWQDTKSVFIELMQYLTTIKNNIFSHKY